MNIARKPARSITTLIGLGALAALLSVAPAIAQDEAASPRMAGEAEVPYASLAGLVRAVNLVVQNDTDEECWTNLNEVGQRMVTILQEAGIGVSDNVDAFGHSPFTPRFELNMSGQRAGDVCIASAQAALYFNNNTQLVFGFQDAVAAARTQQINIMWMNNQALAANENLNTVAMTWGEQMANTVAQRVTNHRDDAEVVAALESWGFTQ